MTDEPVEEDSGATIARLIQERRERRGVHIPPPPPRLRIPPTDPKD